MKPSHKSLSGDGLAFEATFSDLVAAEAALGVELAGDRLSLRAGLAARHELSLTTAQEGACSLQMGANWPLRSGSVARLSMVGLGTAALSEAARVLSADGLLGFLSPLAPTSARSAAYCNVFEALRDPYQAPLMTEIDWRLALEQVGLFPHKLAWVGVVRWVGVWAAEAACSEADIERLRTLILQAPPEIKNWYGSAAGAGWSRYADIRLTVPYLIGWAGRSPLEA